jgi:photosystem II stability/assembly factor-like uncharacterized protein
MSRLLAVTNAGLVRLEARDGAWSAELLRAEDDMRTATFDPRDPSKLFTGGRGTGLHRSSDGGATWEAVELPEADVFSVAVSAAGGAVYAGTEPSRLFVSRDGGHAFEELEGLQEIPSREDWSFPPRPYTSHVRWIAPHPATSALLLVGIELGGVMRSVDGGASFEDHPEGAVADVHALAWHPEQSDRAYEAGGGGAAWTHDRGETWRRLDAGRSRDYCWGLAVDPTDADCWFVSAATSASRAHGSGDSDAAVYRSRDGGAWERVGEGLPDSLHAFPYALAATEEALWVGLGDGRIFRSGDQGERFTDIERGDAQRSQLRGLKHLIPW